MPPRENVLQTIMAAYRRRVQATEDITNAFQAELDRARSDPDYTIVTDSAVRVEYRRGIPVDPRTEASPETYAIRDEPFIHLVAEAFRQRTEQIHIAEELLGAFQRGVLSAHTITEIPNVPQFLDVSFVQNPVDPNTPTVAGAPR